MKGLFRSFLFHLVILWGVPVVFGGGITISQDPKTLGLGALILTCLHLFIGPFLRLILLPLSFATFGLASWLVHILFLFALTRFIPEVQINAWHFPGFSYQGFTLPEANLSWLGTLIIVGMFMGFSKAILEFLAD